MLLRNIFCVKFCIISMSNKLTAEFEFFYLAFHLSTWNAFMIKEEFRGSSLLMFFKIGVLKNFAIFVLVVTCLGERFGIFENFEIVRVKREQFQNLQKSRV